MKAPFIRRFSDRRFGKTQDPSRHERGITMVLVAIAMVAIIAMAAMAIDLVTLFLAREEAQRAADAAALTAAKIISVSGITGTASAPSSNATYWNSICGPSGVATLAAQSAGGQNSVGSITPTQVTVSYAAGGATGNDCSGFSTAAFAVNPLVTVTVRRTNLPTFFSRIWGNTGNSVSATATAEAFNPSASDANGNGGGSPAVTPVQPRCVKPWVVPNQNPFYPISGCSGTECDAFVSIGDGTITHAGISTGGTTSGVIGETFTLFADCTSGSSNCSPPDNPPVANTGNPSKFPGNLGPKNLEYVPGEAPSSSVAVPKCGNGSNYQAAVAGCDQSTAYQCGVSISNASPPNDVDLNENPGGSNGDTAIGLACALTSQSSVPLAGQDVLDTTAYPFEITAGTSNPLKIPSTTQISLSNQIVSLPIYDSSSGGPLVGAGNRAQVTIVGFLQVFINSIDGNGNINVTVLNVAGCGNGTGVPPNNPVNGSSPVPVRLITPP